MEQKKLILLLVAVACIVGLSFYLMRPAARSGRRAGSSSSPAETELLLYCGAGIRPAASALIKAFEARHKIKINATYAGSGRLLGQIVSLQRGDFFMPGAELYVDKAIEKGLAWGESKRIVAYFVPVIFVQKGNPKNIRSILDFSREDIRLGFGDERACAVGKKTLNILEKNDISYSEIEKNVVYKSATVNELGLAIQFKTVDAVILWDANARHFAESGEIVPIPPRQNIPSAIPIVLLKSSKHTEEAGKFIEFIKSEEGRGIWAEKGYSLLLPVQKHPQ